LAIPGSQLAAEYEIDYSSEFTLYNWVQQFNMECSAKSTFALFGSLYFAGLLLGSLVIPRASDLYGRKKMAVAGNILHIITAILILQFHSLGMAIAMNFF